MSRTVRLENLIEKAHVKRHEFDCDDDLEAFGVSNTEGITRTAHRKSEDLGEYLVIEPGLFAYNPYRINVGSIGLTPANVTGVVSPAYVVFRVKKREVIPEVLLDFLKSSEGLRQINKLARGAVRKALRFEDLCEIEFPAIPYERQLEILEHKRGFNKQHGSLLSEITHQQSLLAKLKQAILQEAIAGKLTADWRAAHPDVEPASQLLHRIQAEKARLIATKKLRPEKPLPQITPAEIPFEIPKGWEWCRLGATIEEKPRNGVSLKPVEYVTNAKTLKLSATSSGTFDGSQTKYLDLDVEEDSYLWLRDGDILIQRANSLELVGTAAVYRGAASEFIYPDLMMKSRAVFPESTDYLHHVLSARITRDYFKSKASGSAGNMPKINQDTVTNTLVPLPPLAEQAAIVERVEALMTTCRALEAEIEHARTHAAHLLQAVLKEAFAPAAA
jgi:type I restriction enzyme S subunit